MATENNSEGLTVREWLSRIDAKLDMKADKSDIFALKEELSKQDLRISDLEEESLKKQGADQALAHKSKLNEGRIALLFSVAAGVIEAAYFIKAGHLFG